jgi:alpha-1,3/alpha-1,6-mannosyltransferase
MRFLQIGGYDHRIDENVSYLAELQRLASSLSLTHDTITADPDATPSATASSINASHASVLFLPSISNATKAGLLRTARLLVYTPSNEHFGIVPLEAMRSRVPVLADTTGGPVETVVDGSTGWLRDSNDRAAWTDIIARVLGEMPDDEVKKMGEAGLARVRDTFGRDQMANRLETVIAETLRVQLPRRVLFNTFLNFLIVVMAFAIGLGFAKTYWTVQQMFSSEQA